MQGLAFHVCNQPFFVMMTIDDMAFQSYRMNMDEYQCLWAPHLPKKSSSSIAGDNPSHGAAMSSLLSGPLPGQGRNGSSYGFRKGRAHHSTAGCSDLRIKLLISCCISIFWSMIDQVLNKNVCSGIYERTQFEQIRVRVIAKLSHNEYNN